MSGEHKFARWQNHVQTLSQLANSLSAQTLTNANKTITLTQKYIGESQPKKQNSLKGKKPCTKVYIEHEIKIF